MPDFAIVDAHVHLYDNARVPYPWMVREWPSLNSPHLVPEFDAARGSVEIESLIFCEVRAAPGHNIEEARFIASLAQRDPRIAAITAWAPLENGGAVKAELDALTQVGLVRGIRRGFDNENVGMGLEPGFLAAVRLLGQMGLHYEMGLPHWLLGYGLELARRVETPIVLNHIGMPDIAHNLWEPWRAQISEFGRLPHVSVKLSGALGGAGTGWTDDQIIPFIDHAISSFGFERSMFGSDWPASERFADYGTWVRLVDRAVRGASITERRQLFRETARRIFRIASQSDSEHAKHRERR